MTPKKLTLATLVLTGLGLAATAYASPAPAPVHDSDVMLTCQDGSTANSSVRCWAKNLDKAQNKTCTATVYYQHRFSTDKAWESTSTYATKAVPAGQNVEIISMSRPVLFQFTSTSLSCSNS